ncbi:MAG: type I-E CRISPR-associated protein Cse2/CasB [Desulfovibrionaceae bacterium]|jgi:CRISPR system Cascade subunit CasB|nr:type I-E CRISPR-associated protein Cse2/CasB [Desulfovibrionaceae bacterium]
MIHEREEFQKTFRKWWKSVSGFREASADQEEEREAPDRGMRAELCRAKSPLEVCMTAAFGGGLLPLLEARGIGVAEAELVPLAMLAGIGAHVRTPVEGTPFARLMAAPAREGGGTAAVAPARFRKLLRIQEPDDLYTMLVRLVKMTGQRTNFKSLAWACFKWDDATRVEWAKNYYNALPSKQREQNQTK